MRDASVSEFRGMVANLEEKVQMLFTKKLGIGLAGEVTTYR
jgi:hypothetical protein